MENVLDLVKILLISSPNRACGSHSTQPVLVRAGPGTGKTWMAKQAVFTLADRLLRGGIGISDGIRLVPIVVFVQRIIYLLREDTLGKSGGSLLRKYIESVYSGKKMEAWQEMLMQAYEMRALVVLLDGVDEAAGLRDQIDEFVHKEVVPSGNRVLVTSRPEGIHLATYSKTFVVMNLCQLTNEQQRRVINIQMEGNECVILALPSPVRHSPHAAVSTLHALLISCGSFFDHLLSLGEVRKKLDVCYRKVGAVVRGELETLWSASLWQLGPDTYDPSERQRIVGGSRFVAETTEDVKSEFLVDLDEGMRSEETGQGISLLTRLNQVFKSVGAADGKGPAAGGDPAALELDLATMRERVLQGMVVDEFPGDQHRVAVRLGMLLQKRLQVERQRLVELKAGKERAKKGDAKGEAKVDARADAKGDAKGAHGKGLMEGVDSEALWALLLARTDELYVAHEHLREVFEAVIKKLTIEAAKDDIEAKVIVSGIEFASLKDPVRLHDKAVEEFGEHFSDGVLPEACVPDVTRCRVVLQTGQQIKDFVSRIIGGVQLDDEGMTPVMPSEKAAAEAEAEAAGIKPESKAEPPAVITTELKLLNLLNRFEQLDPTHFRMMVCQLKLTHHGVSIFCEVEVQYSEILAIANEMNPSAHYNFFREKLAGTVPMTQLDAILDEKLVFLVDATGASHETATHTLETATPMLLPLQSPTY